MDGFTFLVQFCFSLIIASFPFQAISDVELSMYFYNRHRIENVRKGVHCILHKLVLTYKDYFQFIFRTANISMSLAGPMSIHDYTNSCVFYKPTDVANSYDTLTYLQKQ